MDITKASEGSLTFPVDKVREMIQQEAAESQATFRRFNTGLRVMAISGGLAGLCLGWVTFPFAVRTGIVSISEPIYPRPGPAPTPTTGSGAPSNLGSGAPTGPVSSPTGPTPFHGGRVEPIDPVRRTNPPPED